MLPPLFFNPVACLRTDDNVIGSYFGLLTIATVNLLAGWVTLSRYSKNPFHSTLYGSMKTQTLLEPLIFCLWAYCLTYSLTVCCVTV